MDTPQMAQHYFETSGTARQMMARGQEMVFPQDNLATQGNPFKEGFALQKMYELELSFPASCMATLKRHCEYFWIFCEGVPNSGMFAMSNILVSIRDNSGSVRIRSSEEIERLVATRPSRTDIISFADRFATLFDDAPQDAIVKEVPESQLTLKVIERKGDECLVSWQLTSNKDDTLYGYWVRCDVSAGGIVIHEEKVADKVDASLPTTIQLERPCDEGQVLISEIPAMGCRLTAYAISPDGQTWYKTELKIPPP